VQKGDGDERQPDETRSTDGGDGERLGTDPLREPRGRQLDDLCRKRKRRQQSDDDRTGAEEERPTGEDRAAGADAEDFGGSTFGNAGIE
jgi:hypothetical protein